MNTPLDPQLVKYDPATCDYCGLPIAGLKSETEIGYCCLGCRIAAEVTQSRGETAAQRWTAFTLGLAVFCTLNVVMLTMALWSYAATPSSSFERALADFFRWGALLFSTPVLLVLGRPLAASALEQYRRGVWSTDLLLLTGVVAAYVVSVITTLQSHGHVYFEVTCVILVLVTLGRWLEATGRLQASAALDQLERLLPDTVRRVSETLGQEIVPRSAVQIGECIRILPGERIPFDGIVQRGRTVVDEQFFTGESLPVEKQPTDSVLGGSANLDGEIIVEVTSAADAGALGRLLAAVRSARLTKGDFQRLADRWSQRFLPLISMIAIAAFVWHGWQRDWQHGLLTALSVVLIACPCALALATPLAIWAALAEAARHGVLFRSGAALERMAALRALRWDKTGTLTTGSPQVAQAWYLPTESRDQLESLTAALVSSSNHPFSQALREDLGDIKPLPVVDDIRSISGRGLIGQSPDHGEIVLGSLRWLEELGLHIPPELAEHLNRDEWAASPLVCIGWDGLIRCAYRLTETLRPEAGETLNQCRELGLDQAVLTGDRNARGALLSQQLQVKVLSELLPEQKLSEIHRTRDLLGCVGMVGDGLNDAPALSAADVGIALGCGADVSRDSADVCLLCNDLQRIPWSYDLAVRTVRTIRQNLCWSFGYNSLGVILAACGWLHPAVAAVLMVVSSLVVLNNSLKLREAPLETGSITPTSPWDQPSPQALLESQS